MSERWHRKMKISAKSPLWIPLLPKKNTKAAIAPSATDPAPHFGHHFAHLSCPTTAVVLLGAPRLRHLEQKSRWRCYGNTEIITTERPILLQENDAVAVKHQLQLHYTVHTVRLPLFLNYITPPHTDKQQQYCVQAIFFNPVMVKPDQ